MKKFTMIAAAMAAVFTAGASAAGTGNLWGNAYADYKINDTKNQTVLGIEGGWTNSQGGAWAGLEQNVTNDSQWVGIGGHYNIHGDVAVFGVTEFERDEDWSSSMYKGGVQYTGFVGENWSTKQYAGVKHATKNFKNVYGYHSDTSDTYGILGASASYKLAQNFTTFVSVDGSATDHFLTEVDVGITYTIPNIPGAYVSAIYENDYQNSDLVDSWKIRAGYKF